MIWLENDHDKICRYLQDYYISLIEAIWYLFEYSFYKEFLAVIHLQVHLLKQHAICLIDNNPVSNQLRLKNTQTILIAFFDYGQEHIDGYGFLY